VRWEQGRLIAADHPDAEAELVLAALGGDRAECVELAQAWGARSDDLEVLAVGPRSAADQLTITPEEIEQLQYLGGWPGLPRYWPGPNRRWPWQQMPRDRATYSSATSLRRTRTSLVGGSSSITARSGGPLARLSPAAGKPDPDRARQIELLRLLALGPEFQLRLSGTVAAAWSAGGSRVSDRAAGRPALVAALAGRLAPAAQSWLGIDPDRADISLHEGPGWGQLAMTGQGTERTLSAALPVGWLASVWAAGLAVVAGHLIVAVIEADWPRATVLGVPEPGAEAAILKVRATAGGWTGSAAREDGTV
jgi:hypothetical protein